MKSKEERFRENLENWEVDCPYPARLLSETKIEKLILCHAANGQLNISSSQGIYHSAENPEIETREWFGLINLEDKETLIVYGVGLGYVYFAAKEWLEKDKNHFLVFLENDLEVLRLLFETETGTEMIKNSQVQIYYVGPNEEKTEIKIHGLNYLLLQQEITVTALPLYRRIALNLYNELLTWLYILKYRGLIGAYEYLDGCRAYFYNFYNNINSLPLSLFGEKLYGRFQGVPAIICGAGPSLAKNIDVLKGLSDRALIFAGGTGMNVLNAYDMIPHFGAGIDPNWAQVTRLVMSQAFETPLLYSYRMNDTALSQTHGDHLFVSLNTDQEMAKSFNKEFIPGNHPIDGGQNIVNMCLMMAYMMGCNPLICVGVDLAYTEERGYGARIPHHPLHDRRDHIRTKQHTEEIIPSEDIYGNPIMTQNQWIVESMWYSVFAKNHPDVKVINATEGGLGFNGIENKTLQEVADDSLQHSYDLDTWVQGEVQRAQFNQPIQRDKIQKWAKKYHENLKECDVLCKKLVKLYQALEKNLNSSKQTVGEIEKINDLKAELEGMIAYREILQPSERELLNYSGEEREELEFSPEKMDPTPRNIRKAQMNCQRYVFLRSKIMYHLPIIEKALESYEKPLHIPKSKKVQTGEITGTYQFKNNRLRMHDPECLLDVDEEFIPDEIEESPSGNLSQCYKNGKLHGPATYRDESGEVVAQGWYLNGKKAGKMWSKFSSGQLKSIMRYQEGLLEGYHETYYADGTPKSRIPYSGGLLEGVVQLHYPSGQLKLEVEFRKGKRNGYERFHESDGLLVSEVQYRENKPHGFAQEWNNRGEIRREITFDEKGNPVQLRERREDGEMHDIEVEEVRDDFDMTARQTSLLTESLSKIISSASDLAPLTSKDGSGASKEFLALREELKKLQELGEKVKSEVGDQKDRPEDVFWKTPKASKMFQKKMGGVAKEMQLKLERIQKGLKEVTDHIQKNQDKEKDDES